MKARFLALWTVAVVASGAAFVTYLALRFETVRLGYALDEANREHKRLAELSRMLALETQTLRQRARVQAIAERTLGMTVPERQRVIAMGGPVQPTLSGRTR